MAKIKNAGGLSGSQVRILNVLAKATTGMTAAEISHAGGGIPVNTTNIGPVFEDVKGTHEESLRGRGLVRAEQYEGDEVQWYITDAGKKLGTTMKGRLIGPNKKVPAEVLDPAVLAFKKKRAYGLEHYTEEDLTALRGTLPQEYHDVDVKPQGDLYNQVLARRKQGAFKDVEQAKQQAMKKILREFGPTGTMIPEFLTEDQVQELYARLGVDVSADVEGD